MVRIQNDLAFDIARRPPDGLDQRRFGTQEPFLVGVENGDQRAFGNVETFAQEIDSDQHVERAQPEIAHDLDAFQSLDVRMHIPHAQAVFVQIFGQVLSHALGERCHQ
jgi:hypothetical protein